MLEEAVMKDVTASNRRIERAEWTKFFEGFSRRHRERPATLEVLGGQGAQTEVRGLPLAGIACDQGGRAITLFFGSESGPQLEHPVEAPKEVWVELVGGGVEAALEIESEGGMKTILGFGTAGPDQATKGFEIH